MVKIGIADTTFSRVNYFDFVAQALEDSKETLGSHDVERYTVPGFKDLPVACKKLIEEYKCDIVIALGMAGPESIDRQCAHEASLGLGQVQLMTNTHVIEVFVHMDEAFVNGILDEDKLFAICKDRAYKHTINALTLLQGKTALSHRAGTGRRQGGQDTGQISK